MRHVCDPQDPRPLLLLPMLPRDIHKPRRGHGSRRGRHHVPVQVLRHSTPSAVETRKHASRIHVPKNHVDYCYPFTSDELEVVAAKDEDKYNNVIKPRLLPLRPGYFALRVRPSFNPTGTLGLNWYEPQPRDTTTSGSIVPLPREPRHPGNMCRTASILDCRLCQSPGCTMV